jgi:hypothetical protein
MARNGVVQRLSASGCNSSQRKRGRSGGVGIMGVLVRALRSADWMSDTESRILNRDCCYGIVVENGGRESALDVERRECGLLRCGTL